MAGSACHRDPQFRRYALFSSVNRKELILGSIKEYWFNLQEEEKAKWIRERLDDANADEGTDGWDDLSTEYDLRQESLREKHEFEAAIEWYEKHSYSEIHYQFSEEILELKSILSMNVDLSHKNAIYKMVYAHSVALLESYLGDTIKTLIKSHDKFFSNAINNVDELNKSKFNLKEITEQKDGAIGLAIKEISKILYHNIPKVKRIYESVLGTKLDINISDVDKITATRHDIVHRNGKTTDGVTVLIDREAAEQAISHIEKLAERLNKMIYEQVN